LRVANRFVAAGKCEKSSPFYGLNFGFFFRSRRSPFLATIYRDFDCVLEKYLT